MSLKKNAENKNAEADFKNPCSYKMKSVYYVRYYVIKVTLETNFAERDPFSKQILLYDMLSPQKIDPNN